MFTMPSFSMQRTRKTHLGTHMHKHKHPHTASHHKRHKWGKVNWRTLRLEVPSSTVLDRVPAGSPCPFLWLDTWSQQGAAQALRVVSYLPFVPP